MITKDMKISKMLEAYPSTLDILLQTSPHFNKLKNKLLRKTLSSRVNVEQAAAIAGVDLNLLLFNLNKIVNPISASKFESANSQKNISEIADSADDFLQSIKDRTTIMLDVRPIIESGRDPFTDIMAKVKSLKDDDIFLLINSFEPIPLYSVLGKKNFKHKTIKIGNEFNVYFFRDNIPFSSDDKVSDIKNDEQEIDHELENIIEIDVRELPPPEPMMKILETLSKVDEKTVLVVHHHREPLMLYPKLEERGYKAICSKINENYFKVVIVKNKDDEK